MCSHRHKNRRDHNGLAPAQQGNAAPKMEPSKWKTGLKGSNCTKWWVTSTLSEDLNHARTHHLLLQQNGLRMLSFQIGKLQILPVLKPNWDEILALKNSFFKSFLGARNAVTTVPYSIRTERMFNKDFSWSDADFYCWSVTKCIKYDSSLKDETDLPISSDSLHGCSLHCSSRPSTPHTPVQRGQNLPWN